METGLSFSSASLLSHPNKALNDHLKAVAELASISLNRNPTVPINRDILERVIEIVALSHDIGKANGYFQNYISAPEEKKPGLKSKKSTHSLFGAVATYFLVKEFLEEEGKLSGLNEFLPIASFLACKKHHGDLSKINYELIINGDDEALLKDQLLSIERDKFDALLRGIGNPFTYDWLEQNLKNLKDVFFDVEDDANNFLHNKSLYPYFITHLIYSLLIDSDKNEIVVSINDLINIVNLGNLVDLSAELVVNYKKNILRNDREIDELRERAFQEVMENQINLEQNIYSINLPTGLGKTLTSLAFALKLRDAVRKEKSYHPRIIYSLPFLGIIDQNFSVFEDLFYENGIDPLTHILLKHHHLSEISYKWKNSFPGEADFEFDASKILIEGWNSEVIVTTFFQLLHTLISNKNRSIRKFHRIVGSIVILDEVQAIPHKYWLLIHDIFKYLADNFGVYFVFVTATEPLIFNREEVKSLVERDKYFTALNRVKLKPRIKEPETIEEFGKRVIKEVIESEKKFLFIFNTIGSAKEFYNLLKDTGIDKEEMTYLTTHIIPKERLERIKEIRNGAKRIVVSTQLVEAGVDIDFDIVYRDFSPLDSINQSAGRCNRNGLSSGGEVRVVRLIDEKTNREYASYIYNKDSILLDITKKLLSNEEEIQEKQFLSLIEKYYGLVTDAKSDQISRDVLEAFYKLNYDENKGISSFSFIEEDYEKADVFIQYDEAAAALWDRYLEISRIPNLFERKNSFGQIKADFYKYVVSVPFHAGTNMPAIQEGIPFVSISQLDEYYDRETGYKLKGGVAIW